MSTEKIMEQPVNARLLEALKTLRDALRDHPEYAQLSEEQEEETGGDTAEFSYLVRVADEAIAAAEAQQERLLQDMHDAGREIDRVMAEPAPEAVRQTDYSSTVDRAWARFCGAFGDGPDAPYPGMIAAFETHYGQSFRDKEWRTEAACWAAAWSKATARAESTLAEPKPDADGWIPWVGGECPVNPDALVRVRFADFLEEGGCRARQYQWHRSNPHDPSDIVAYRVAGESK